MSDRIVGHPTAAETSHAALCVCGWGTRRPSRKSIYLAVDVHLAQAGTGCDHSITIFN